MFDFFAQRFSSIFSTITGQRTLTVSNIEEALAKVHDTLIEADVPYTVAQTFCQELKAQVVGQKVLASLKPSEQLIKVTHDTLIKFLSGNEAVQWQFQSPAIIMVMGLQGAGKTTLLAKLAHLLRQQAAERNKQRSILIASVDFYRPAALDQLEILTRQVGATWYRPTTANVTQAAQEIVNYYRANNFDYLLLDTAGRLHVDAAMMQEVKTVAQIVQPRYRLLVLDAMTGQESLNVAQIFEQEVGFDAAVLTKADSQTRMGAAFAFRYTLKKPIIYVGVGEKLVDLEAFRPDRIATRMLGMGDLETLLEKANAAFKQSEQEQLKKALQTGSFTLDDFGQQLAMMGKLGSLSQLAKYIPGVNNAALSPDVLEKGEKELKKFRAILGSMTVKERICPALLNSSRKQRIARGAGVVNADINLLLERFEQSKQFAKLFKKFGK